MRDVGLGLGVCGVGQVGRQRADDEARGDVERLGLGRQRAQHDQWRRAAAAAGSAVSGSAVSGSAAAAERDASAAAEAVDRQVRITARLR